VVACAAMPPRIRLIWRIVAPCLALAGAAAQANPNTPDSLSAWLSERGIGSDASVLATPRDRMTELVVAAMNFVGVPYALGGTDAGEGFDCSGFTRHLFQLELGLALPRRSHEQAAAGGFVAVERASLRPGDLVFFNTLQRAFSHVGIYVGEGRFIHSPRPGATVRLESMGSRYWQHRFDGARRAALAMADAEPRRAAPVIGAAGPIGGH
jgi:cell wall-associated NlpC family hydrolase